MRPFLAALQFLTILPVRRPFAEGDLERAPQWFPLVGLVIGLTVAATDCLGGRLGLPPAIRNILSVGLLAGLSGGLHLDGLADAADGFLSARPRERALEIMRDSRIGAMGVLALVFVLALKAGALSGLVGEPRWRVLVLAPLAGRSMQLTAMNLMPYARGDGGLATIFIRRRHSLKALWGGGWLAAGSLGLFGLTDGLILIAAGLIGTALLAAWSVRRIGGFTGDTLGATSEVVEMLGVVVVSCGYLGR